MLGMKSFLASKDISFLIYLQPTLLSKYSRPLSKLERGVRERWRRHHRTTKYYNYDKSYNYMRKFLKQENFHFIDGRNLLKYNLFSGELEVGKSYELKNKASKKNRKLILKKFHFETDKKNKGLIKNGITLISKKKKTKIKLIFGLRNAKKINSLN